MATLREQFEASKQARDMSQGALDDINAKLDDIAEYRTWRELRRLEREKLNYVRQQFIAAGIEIKDDLHFSQLRTEWAKHLTVLSEAWHNVDEAEAKLAMIKRQMRSVKMREFQHLLSDLNKARIARTKCETEFKRLRDLVYRARQAREAAKPQIEAEARDTVRLVTAVLDNPSEPLRKRIRESKRDNLGGRKAKPAGRRGNRGNERAAILEGNGDSAE